MDSKRFLLDSVEALQNTDAHESQPRVLQARDLPKLLGVSESEARTLLNAALHEGHVSFDEAGRVIITAQGYRYLHLSRSTSA